ncbi:hypothetical protein SCLCIDRAFT_1209355 [Scleroderma citrinum Foug A]|uniref:Uncharacterized protein n=1 Tax=Scleroderma citrinum Foug A TaxID=1036808 RepID=A0A0C3A4C8_9AGAM|nr:hypothetical protein SCLCIDRAFT_1209355 [Scleroderma citrinum Foug A]
MTPSQRDNDSECTVVRESATSDVLHTICSISWDRPFTNRYERDLIEEHQDSRWKH